MRARGPRHQVGARHGHAERHARRDPLRNRHHVRLDAGELDREHLAGSPHPRLYFVDDEQDAMPSGQLSQALEKLVGRDHVAALALNRLDDNRRHLIGRDEMREQLMLDVIDAHRRAVLGRRTRRRPVTVREWRVVDPRHQRPEPATLDRLARRQRERSHAAAVESAEKRDDVLAAGRVAGERGNRRQLLRKAHLRLVVEVRSRHVQELLRLIRDRLDHVRVRVAGRIHRDARRAVEEDVAVDVLDHRAASALDDERIPARVRRRNNGFVPVDDGFSFRSWEEGLDLWGVGHGVEAGPKGPALGAAAEAAVKRTTLLSFPPGTTGAIFEKHTSCREVVADAVGGGELAAAPGLLPIFDQTLDLLDRHRWLIVLGEAEAEHAQHLVEPFERLADAGHIASAELAGVNRGVQRPHQLENRAQPTAKSDLVFHYHDANWS